MQLSHSQVVAPHSAIHRAEIMPQTNLEIKSFQSIVLWSAPRWEWATDPVSSSCCATFRLLILSRASSRTWMGSYLLDLVSQHRTVPSMDPRWWKHMHRVHTNMFSVHFNWSNTKTSQLVNEEYFQWLDQYLTHRGTKIVLKKSQCSNRKIFDITHWNFCQNLKLTRQDDSCFFIELDTVDFLRTENLSNM